MSFYKAPRYILRKRNILNFLKDLKINTFVDVGCGAGELAVTLAKKGYNGIGLDFSADAIKTADNLRDTCRIPEEQLRFIQGDEKKLGNKKYDLVMCFEVLEHVKNDRKLLKKIGGISNKYVLISVPAKQRLFDDSDLAVGHFRRYEKDDLLSLINAADLDVMKFASYGYPFTNLVRVGRKAFFKAKLRKNKDSIKKRTKESGINPIKLPEIFSSIDIEPISIPFYQFSRLFNKTNLSEGYLVLCEKKK